MTVDCQSCDFAKGFFVEREGNPVEFQQFRVLLDDGVLRFGQDATEGFFIKFIECDGDGKSSHKFRHEAELHEVIGFALIEEFTEALLFLIVDCSTESHAATLGALRNDVFQTLERSTADEEDVPRVN